MPQTFVLPRQLALDEDAVPLSGALLYFFQTLTTTPQAVFSDAALTTQHTQPVAADSSGVFPKIYLNPDATVDYRVRLTTSDGTLLYQEDDIDPLVISQEQVGRAIYPRTVNEIAAGITPTNYRYEPGHVYRYGTNTTPGTTDMSAAFQNAINACSSGGVVYLPDELVSIGTTGITCTKSITIQGTGGREDFDNSWNSGGGSQIWYKGLTGHALSFTTPNAINSRTKLRLRDFVVRGARVNPGGAANGCCIVIDGRQLAGTAIHLDIENVYVCEARDEGWYITGAVYGGNARNVGAYDCGKNGMRLAGQADPIGEMVWSTVRLFDNGAQGSSDEQAGLRAVPGATCNVFHGLSCTNNTGPGAILQSGSFAGSGWQFESNSGTSQLYIGSAGGGAGVTSCVVNGLAFSPGTGYTGNIINVTSDANHCKFHGIIFNDTLAGAGRDLLIAGGNCSVYGITSAHTLVYSSSASDTYLEGYMPTFSANVGSDISNVTGDGTSYTVIWGTEVFDATSSYNTTTGVFTAPLTGKYEFRIALTLGGIAAGHDRGVLSLVTSNRTYSQRLSPAQIANVDGRASFFASFLVDMDAADTASVTVQVDNGALAVDVLSSGYSWFSGRWVST